MHKMFYQIARGCALGYILQVVIFRKLVDCQDFNSNDFPNSKIYEDYPCPNSENILPCVCYTYFSTMYLYCPDVTIDQLSTVLEQDFPMKNFTQFSMESSTHIQNMDVNFHGLSFKEYSLEPGPFSIETIENSFFVDSKDTVENIRIYKSKLEKFPFSELGTYSKLETLKVFNSSLSSFPNISSNSLKSFEIWISNIIDIEPGEYIKSNYLQTNILFYCYYMLSL